MAAYRADIEIGVRGVRDLEQLRSEINKTGRAVDSLNSVVSARGSLVQNIQNYTNNLNRAAKSLRLVAAGTEAETKAVREYVRALGEANAARARQNSLVAQEIAGKRRVTAGTAPYGQQGPALPPAMVKVQQIQQNWSKFFQEAAQLGQELQTTAAAKALNIRTSWNRFFQEAAQTGQELQADTFAKTARIKTSWNRFFQEAANVAVELQVQAQRTAAVIRSQEGLASAAARGRLAEEAARRQRITNAGFGVQGPALPPSAVRASGKGMRGRLGGAISGGVIGGAFPLLFGQGGGAATGGAIGGFLGGLAGPGGSFAGSLIGTLLGDIASKGQAVKQLGQDLGFSAQQAQVLATAFKTANTDVEKFTTVIQNIRGVGLELEDQAKAVQLVTRLTENYKASFEKVGNAITSALESGKVSQATLNQLSSQGIDIQGALADKFNTSRDRILEMAKKGQISVQALIDTLVELGNKPADVANKTQTASQQLQSAMSNLTKIIGPELERLTTLFVQFGTVALNALNGVLERLGQVAKGIENAIAGDTLKNAQTQFRRDAKTLKELYKTPREERSAQQIRRITMLENLQQGRLEVIQAAQPQKITPLQPFKPPSQLAPSGGGRSDKDAARAAKQLQEQLRNARNLVTQKQAEFNLTKAISEEDKLKAKYEETRTERMQNYAKLLNKSLSDAERASLIQAQTLDIQISNTEYEKELSGIRKQQVEDLYTTLGASNLLNLNFERMASFVGAGKPALAFNPNMNLVPSLTGGELGGKAEQARLELEKLIAPAEQLASAAEGIGSAFANSFKGVASGAMTAQEALSAFFQTVADRFLDMAAQIIAKWIEMTILNSALRLFPGGTLFTGAGPVSGAAAFSGAGIGSAGFNLPPLIPMRAAGGPVSAGSPYIVGERGPELFVPGRSGSIVPNDSLGGDMMNVVVNVDANGSNVQGDGNQANQLGKAIGIAVQQELIKQKRPGGLLA